MSKIKKFIYLPFHEKILFFESLFWLICAKIILLILPFRKIIPLLRQKISKETAEAKLSDIKAALSRASGATPWHNTCLTKSIAARWMLKQRKIYSRMAIGMVHDEKGKLVMHAWLTAGKVEIVSRNNYFKELYLFE